MVLPPTSMGLLGSVVGLNLWTFFMEGWMYKTRIPEINRMKTPISNTATKEEIFNSKDYSPSVRWKADNFSHLFEQPTQFYALAIVTALLAKEGATKGALGIELGRLDVQLAWTYVGIRIVHSLVHSISNHIMTRFSLYVTSSAVLLGLAARSSAVLFG